MESHWFKSNKKRSTNTSESDVHCLLLGKSNPLNLSRIVDNMFLGDVLPITTTDNRATHPAIQGDSFQDRSLVVNVSANRIDHWMHDLSLRDWINIIECGLCGIQVFRNDDGEVVRTAKNSLEFLLELLQSALAQSRFAGVCFSISKDVINSFDRVSFLAQSQCFVRVLSFALQNLGFVAHEKKMQLYPTYFDFQKLFCKSDVFDWILFVLGSDLSGDFCCS